MTARLGEKPVVAGLRPCRFRPPPVSAAVETFGRSERRGRETGAEQDCGTVWTRRWSGVATTGGL